MERPCEQKLFWAEGSATFVLTTPISVFCTSADSTKKAPDVKVLPCAWMLKSLCCEVACHLTVFS